MLPLDHINMQRNVKFQSVSQPAQQVPEFIQIFEKHPLKGRYLQAVADAKPPRLFDSDEEQLIFNQVFDEQKADALTTHGLPARMLTDTPITLYGPEKMTTAYSKGIQNTESYLTTGALEALGINVASNSQSSPPEFIRRFNLISWASLQKARKRYLMTEIWRPDVEIRTFPSTHDMFEYTNKQKADVPYQDLMVTANDYPRSRLAEEIANSP